MFVFWVLVLKKKSLVNFFVSLFSLCPNPRSLIPLLLLLTSLSWTCENYYLIILINGLSCLSTVPLLRKLCEVPATRFSCAGRFPFSWHPCVPLVPSHTLPCQLPVLEAAFSAPVGVVQAGFWRQQVCGGTLERSWTTISFCSSVQECWCLERGSVGVGAVM